MSDFACLIVKLDKVGKHPYANTLSITTVDGEPTIFRTGDFESGSLALYIPTEAVIDQTREWTNQLAFLKWKDGKHRVKAIKLRGIFSKGLLIPIPDELKVTKGSYPALGTNVAEQLGIIKYEEPDTYGMNTDNEKDPGFLPTYKVYSYRKYKHLLVPGEEVVVTEKLHGCNGRFAYKDEKFYVGSHNHIKKYDERNLWWQVAIDYDLAVKLSTISGIVVYGEVYGQVQDLKYDLPGKKAFAVFDMYDSRQGIWLNDAEIETISKGLGIPLVPKLYQGPYDPAIIEPLASGKSTIASHFREGFVIRPVQERWNMECSRTLFKLHGEEFQLRKGGTEYQ